MRPTRLELNGFASFRQPTTLDFTDVELFVLSGPTGAGKSSIIDAMTFCLYGSVPRYDDKRLVAPVISQGQLEARVRLDFTVEGRAYTAVRVVRRTKSGATTKEARLERNGQTLASSADELTSAVHRLLGLSFEHFTRTVVLPQGDFQEFLHAKPGDRQDLLVQLLDLDVYRRVATAARSDEAAAKGALEGLRSRLEGELGEATDEAVAAATTQATQLARLVADLDQARPELDELVERGRTARQRADQANSQRDAVAAIEAPAGLDALAARLAEASDAATRAAEAAAEAAAGLDTSRADRSQRPPTATVRQVIDALDALVRAEEATKGLTDAVTAAEQTGANAETVRAAAETEAERAGAALEQLRREHRAHALAEGLAAGDPCPVCERELREAPRVDRPADLDEAAAAVDAARAALREREVDARRAAEAAANAKAQAEAGAATIEDRRRTLDAARGDLALPSTADELAALAQELAEADRAVTQAEADERRARTALTQATGAVNALGEERTAAFRALGRTRDTVAALEPPPVDHDDLGDAWAALLAWARDALPKLEEAATDADEAITAASDEYRKRLADLRAGVTEAGLDVPAAPGPDQFSHLRDACVAASTRASQRAEHLSRLRDQAKDVRASLASTERRAALSKALGQHLNARKFEKWLLNRALQRLVVGASDVLRELSSGGYSLALGDDNNFLVIDHRNADEQRSARTLSGGETFLASLSLALSLADDVAAMSANGAARLEALFLDEGFGTLDADTLDTVASAIEELGSKGRMVGLITHVRDLSERVPVRYEVRRGPGGSTVDRIVT